MIGQPDLMAAFAADLGLAKDILDHANAKLLTGTTLSCPEPGCYRLCFTTIERDRLIEAVERMCRYLRSRTA